MYAELFPTGPEHQGQVSDTLPSGQKIGLLVKLGRLAGASLLIMGSALGLLSAEEATSHNSAHADITFDDFGYPWAAAPCEFGMNGGASCANPNDPKGDLYDWGEYDSKNVFHPYRNGYEYRNCTDYVQWKESTLGVTVPGTWQNGGQWYNNAPASERTTAPKAWDAAVQPVSSTHPAGHLAFVESVDAVDASNPDNDIITVTEYNYDGKGDGDTRSGVASAMGFTKFIDFGKHPSADQSQAPCPPLPDNLFVLQGNTLYGKAELNNTWSMLTNAAQSFQAAGQRVAIVDTNGNIEAKEGLRGPWDTEAGAVDQYIITPNLLAIRVGGTIYAKAELTAPWTTITASGATSLKAAGGRIAWQDTSGTIWGRDGIQGTSVAETSGAVQYEVTPNLFLVRQGTTLLGKTQLTDQWSTLTNAAVDVEASANRIAIMDTDGAIEAKDNLSDVWETETSGAAQYLVTPDLLIIRQGGYTAWQAFTHRRVDNTSGRNK